MNVEQALRQSLELLSLDLHERGAHVIHPEQNILDLAHSIEARLAPPSHSDVSADLRAALDATEEPSDDVAPGWETDRAYIWRSGWDARGVAIAALAAPSARAGGPSR